jgi:hypothetical protein
MKLSGIVLFVSMGFSGLTARADTVTLWTQPIAFELPAPTEPLLFGLALGDTPLQAVQNPTATLLSTGSATFTANDPGFAAFVAYLLDPNPSGFVFPFFAYGGTKVGNFYGGHFDNYPGGPLTPPDPLIEEIFISVDPIAGFQEQNGIWSARTPSGAEAFAYYGIQGERLVPEPGCTLLLLVLGFGIVSVKNALSKEKKSLQRVASINF